MPMLATVDPELEQGFNDFHSGFLDDVLRDVPKSSSVEMRFQTLRVSYISITR